MRCNCENSECQLHEPAKCEEIAYVRCRWIGGVCLDCAVSLREYLIPIPEDGTGGAANPVAADLEDEAVDFVISYVGYV